MVAEHALAQGYDRSRSDEQKQFLYLPFMHSERLGNQLRALALFESEGMTENRRFAEEHVAIIRRFGRFPHRNAIFGRASTEAELQYLSQFEEHFGQPVPEINDSLNRCGRRRSDAATRPAMSVRCRAPTRIAAPQDALRIGPDGGSLGSAAPGGAGSPPQRE